MTLSVSLPQEPVYVEADPTRLQQVVGNLLSNAAKYTDRGGNILLTAWPVVVVLDLGMSGMDGFEVAFRLRGQPGSDGVLLVALAGWAQEENRRRYCEAVFDGHMPKPLEWDALRQFLAHPKFQKPAAQA